MSLVRQPAVAGAFHPGQAQALTSDLRAMLGVRPAPLNSSH
ncbi:hypothetical protein [Rhodoferax sp.]|nr:hypothetical protein [Rhodoferax sp.]